MLPKNNVGGSLNRIWKKWRMNSVMGNAVCGVCRSGRTDHLIDQV
jgi:hypothetical protein